MKQIILALAITTSFAACHDNKFKAAEMQQKGEYATSDYNNAISEEIGYSAHALPLGSLARPQSTIIVEKPVVVKETHYVTSSNSSSPAKTKKGWSKAAKGTVIGAGTGAVLGAVISKKKGKGAVIGGILGAGG